MAGLFDPPSIGGGGSVPTMPGAIPQAGFGANGGAFNDIQNLLSGNAGGQGFDMAGLNSGIQSLAYGIGSFAKNPQTRAAYIQAAQAHEQHKNSSAQDDYKTLLSIAPQFEKLLQEVQGNPQASAALQPMLDQYTQNLDMAAKRAGKSSGLGDSLSQYFKAVAAAPAELQPAESPGAKVLQDISRGLYKGHEDAAAAALKEATGQNKTDVPRTREYIRGSTRIYEEQLPDGTWKELGQGPAFAPPTQVVMPQMDMVVGQHGEFLGMGPGARDEATRRAASLFQEMGPDYAVANQYFGTLGNTADQITQKLPLVGNFFVSEDYQRARQAALNVVGNMLYGKSGAQLTETEVKRANETYIPQLGDKPATIADKQARFRAVMLGAGTRGNIKNPQQLLEQVAPQAPAAPAAPPPPVATPPMGPAAAYREGDIAVNPQTGAKLIRRNGQWVPQ